MPFKIEWEEKGVYSTLWGSCSIADVMSILQTIESDTRFRSLRYNLVNYLEVTESNGSKEDVAEVSALNYAQSLSNSRLVRAIVATDPKILALVQGWIAISDTPELLGVFSTLMEAREWIKEKVPGVLF